MSVQIHKYKLSPDQKQEVEMPWDSRVLDVQMQNNAPVMWAAVNTEYTMVRRTVYIVPTGKDLDFSVEECDHVATVQIPEKEFVFHVFISR